MTETVLNRLKSGALNCASAVLNKMNIATEESRIKEKYEALGRRLLPALENDALDTLRNDPDVVELVGAISEMRTRLNALKTRAKKYKGKSR